MAARRASTAETPTTARATARQTDPTPEDSDRKCVRKGCHHPRNIHVINGSTCWGKTTCPCTGYAGDRSILKAEETEAEPNEPIPGGPETGITMSTPVPPEDDGTDN